MNEGDIWVFIAIFSRTNKFIPSSRETYSIYEKKKIKNRNERGSMVMYLCLLGNFARLHSRFIVRFRFHFAPRFVYLLASRICARADVTSRFVFVLRCYHLDLSIVLLRRDGEMEMITRCEIQASFHKLTFN